MRVAQTRESIVHVAMPDGAMDVTVTRPDTTARPLPGLVLFQEAFGVNEHVRDVARRWALRGYVVATPDLYHRLGQRVVSYDDVGTAKALVLSLQPSQVADDADAALEVLRRVEVVAADRLGVIGFCYGGQVAFVTACRHPELKAAISFYGGGIAAPESTDEPLRLAEHLRVPWLGLFGGQDQMIPAEHVERIRAELERLGAPYRIEIYGEAGHGFFCDARPRSYHEPTALLADALTTRFFAENLAAAEQPVVTS